MSRILHIADHTQWRSAQESGEYVADSLPTQGFIHCSTPEQVIAVANFLFKGQKNLVLLEMDTDLLGVEIRFENLEGGTKLFPHVFGPVKTTAVVNVYDFPPGPEGTFELPGPLRKET